MDSPALGGDARVPPPSPPVLLGPELRSNQALLLNSLSQSGEHAKILACIAALLAAGLASRLCPSQPRVVPQVRVQETVLPTRPPCMHSKRGCAAFASPSAAPQCKGVVQSLCVLRLTSAPLASCERVVLVLLDAGSEVNAKNNHGCTPEDVASSEPVQPPPDPHGAPTFSSPVLWCRSRRCCAKGGEHGTSHSPWGCIHGWGWGWAVWCRCWSPRCCG